MIGKCIRFVCVSIIYLGCVVGSSVRYQKKYINQVINSGHLILIFMKQPYDDKYPAGPF